MPAPLDQAFGGFNEIQVKKKKRSKKDIIYPQELQALTDSNILPNETESFFPVQQFQKSPHQVKEDQLRKKQEELDKREMWIQQQVQQCPRQRKQTYPERLVISDEEWVAFQEYQKKRYNKALQRPINSVEGFANINDDFNDVLLFGLLGIFFLIFTDYIYKLGKKSY